MGIAVYQNYSLDHVGTNIKILLDDLEKFIQTKKFELLKGCKTAVVQTLGLEEFKKVNEKVIVIKIDVNDAATHYVNSDYILTNTGQELNKMEKVTVITNVVDHDFVTISTANGVSHTVSREDWDKYFILLSAPLVKIV